MTEEIRAPENFEGAGNENRRSQDRRARWAGLASALLARSPKWASACSMGSLAAARPRRIPTSRGLGRPKRRSQRTSACARRKRRSRRPKRKGPRPNNSRLLAGAPAAATRPGLSAGLEQGARSKSGRAKLRSDRATMPSPLNARASLRLSTACSHRRSPSSFCITRSRLAALALCGRHGGQAAAVAALRQERDAALAALRASLLLQKRRAIMIARSRRWPRRLRAGLPPTLRAVTWPAPSRPSTRRLKSRRFRRLTLGGVASGS